MMSAAIAKDSMILSTSMYPVDAETNRRLSNTSQSDTWHGGPGTPGMERLEASSGFQSQFSPSLKGLRGPGHVSSADFQHGVQQII